MPTRWKLGLWSFGFLVAVSLPTLSRAGVEYYEVRVDGLACPFCAYGLEKKLTALAGVTEVDIDLDAGRVAFAVKGTDVVPPERVRAAILAAGFTPRVFSARVTGIVYREAAEFVLELAPGHRLQLDQNAGGVGLRELPEQASVWIVAEGELRRRPNGSWSLVTKRVRLLQERDR